MVEALVFNQRQRLLGQSGEKVLFPLQDLHGLQDRSPDRWIELLFQRRQEVEAHPVAEKSPIEVRRIDAERDSPCTKKIKQGLLPQLEQRTDDPPMARAHAGQSFFAAAAHHPQQEFLDLVVGRVGDGDEGRIIFETDGLEGLVTEDAGRLLEGEAMGCRVIAGRDGTAAESGPGLQCQPGDHLLFGLGFAGTQAMIDIGGDAVEVEAGFGQEDEKGRRVRSAGDADNNFVFRL